MQVLIGHYFHAGFHLLGQLLLRLKIGFVLCNVLVGAISLAFRTEVTRRAFVFIAGKWFLHFFAHR